MVYHIPAKEYAIYETHPAQGVEIVAAPKEVGNLESLAGVNAILEHGYRLVCHTNRTNTAEVLPLRQLDKERFRVSFAKGEIVPWIAPIRVWHLKGA